MEANLARSFPGRKGHYLNPSFSGCVLQAFYNDNEDEVLVPNAPSYVLVELFICCMWREEQTTCMTECNFDSMNMTESSDDRIASYSTMATKFLRVTTLKINNTTLVYVQVKPKVRLC